MRQRAEKVRTRFGVTVCHQKLRLFYRRHGIRWRRTYECFRGEVLDPVGIELLRTDFANRLDYILLNDQPVVYMDETSFTSWTRQDRTW